MTRFVHHIYIKFDLTVVLLIMCKLHHFKMQYIACTVKRFCKTIMAPLVLKEKLPRADSL